MARFAPGCGVTHPGSRQGTAGVIIRGEHMELVIVVFCSFAITCLIIYGVYYAASNSRQVLESLIVLFTLLLTVPFAILLRVSGIMSFIAGALPVSVCLCIAIGVLVELVLVVTRSKLEVDAKDVASCLFGFMMLAAFGDIALCVVETQVTCSMIANDVSTSFEICDDVSGYQGMCMSSHLQPITVEELCVERALGPMTWPAANYRP